MTELDLRETLQRHLDDVDVPPAPLGRVVARAPSPAPSRAVVAALGGSRPGRGRRHRRRARDAGTTRVAAWTPRVRVAGPLDFSHGARAYADPGGELHLAGRTFPDGDLDYLDTDAVATSYGMVFFDDGRPMLLGADGEVGALVAGPLDDPDGFHPTAKVDSVHPWVAYATRPGTTTTVTVHDLADGRDVASTRSTARGCTDVVIDALDDGVVYLRIDQLTRSWDVVTASGRPSTTATAASSTCAAA